MNKINTRLNNVLTTDKQNNPKYMKEIIRSDIFFLINNYFDIDYESVVVNIEVNEFRKFDITINMVGDRPKFMNTISSSKY
ncbi:MAG: cell division topological specificity factor MinE [Clostridia bacterium]|nr:cell division topological specificity factor MinE [Clostridia bacterium]